MIRLAYIPYNQMFCEYVEWSNTYNMNIQQYHNAYEIYLQVKGERHIFMNGACFTLKPMDLYIVEPYELHYTQSLDSSFYGRYVLNFDDEQLRSILSADEHRFLMERITTGVYHLDEHHFNIVHHLFKKLDECQNDQGPLANKLKCSYLFLMLNQIRDCSELRNDSITNDSTIRPEIFSAINYINKHYREQITLDNIAGHIDMSRYHFCRLFKTATGSSFVQYLNNLRISKAHKLLLETTLSIADIASLTGFATREQLTRVFKSGYCVSPTEFRKQNKSAKARAGNE